MNYMPSVVLVLFGTLGAAMPYYYEPSVTLILVSVLSGALLFRAGYNAVLAKINNDKGKIVPFKDVEDRMYVIHKIVSNTIVIIKDGSMNHYAVDPVGEMLQMSEGQAFQKKGGHALKI